MYILSPWLEIYMYYVEGKQNNKNMSASSLPSYVLRGGIPLVPENDVPYRLSHSPAEIY